VREMCRLVFPTDGDISALRRILDNALAGVPPNHGTGNASAA